MQEYAFSELADRMPTGRGFSDSNVLAYDGDLDLLPKIKLVRHGNVGKHVADCRIEMGQGARDAMTIFVGEGAASVKIGRTTILNVNIRLWHARGADIGDFTTINNARIVADKSDVKIGRDCLFSAEILIQSTDRHRQHADSGCRRSVPLPCRRACAQNAQRGHMDPQTPSHSLDRARVL